MTMDFKEGMHATDRGNPISRINRLPFLLVGLAVTFSINGTATAQASSSDCGPIDGARALDYREGKTRWLNEVESVHFTPLVENLIRGQTAALGGDIGYTLSHSPNHHRALIAMMRLGEKLKTPQPYGSEYSVECWFERALRFRPDDNVARQIYATYLIKNRREPEAIKQLEVATQAAGDNAFTHYNIGLIYFDIKKYDRALTQAHTAYDLGFGRPELRERLKSVGKWTEPVEPSAKPNDESLPDTNQSGTGK